MIMVHNILITGASGYLGGTLFARWEAANLPKSSYNKVFALVRKDEQARAVKELYGAEPLMFSLKDETATRNAIVSNNITIVYYLIDAVQSEAQVNLIKALAEVKKTKGGDVHFLHTTGAKIFSSHAAAPTDKPLLDSDRNIYDIQKQQTSTASPLKKAVETNCTITEAGEQYGVRTYIFAPCIVYGKGEGFGNVISIQTVAIVKVAKAAGRVYKVDKGRPTWPVCHVLDNTLLYIEILRSILNGSIQDYGKQGYYLAASGSVAWDDLYTAMAKALKKRGVVEEDSIAEADDKALEAMAKGLGSASPQAVAIELGGSCTFTAERGSRLGWAAQYPPEHILATADEEVNLILQNLK